MIFMEAKPARSVREEVHIDWLISEIPRLKSEGVLDEHSSQALHRHYAALRSLPSTSKLAPLICALLGSALIGCGIILLIAHNWDDLSRPVRAGLSFCPLLIAIIASCFSLTRRFESPAWREGTSIFQAFAVGASISLISQTYNIDGTFSSFMLVWLLLVIPTVYLFRSSGVAVLCLIGATARMVADSNEAVAHPPTGNWLLLLLLFPHFLRLVKHRETVPLAWCLWTLVCCLPLFLGSETAAIDHQVWTISFSSLFTTFYLLSTLPFWGNKSLWFNPLKIGGTLGVGILSLILSYQDVWMVSSKYDKVDLNFAALFLTLFFPMAVMGLIFYLQKKNNPYHLAAALFPLFVGLAWLTADHHPRISFILINAYVLTLAVSVMVKGFRVENLFQVNTGLILFAALIVIRFFDSNLGFIVRGISDILVGIAFLSVNYFALKQKKERLS